MGLDIIYNEDCLQGMKQIPDGTIDCCVTSPPYDNLRTYGGVGDGWNFETFKAIATELARITKEGGVIVWNVNDQTENGSKTGNSFRQCLFFMDAGLNLNDTMIWRKTNPMPQVRQPRYASCFEYMFVFSKGKPKTINLIRDRKNLDSREGDNGTKRLVDGTLLNVSRGGYEEYGRRTNIWRYNIGKGHSTKDDIAFEHPAIFPESLAGDHIKTWSNEGDIVLEPFCGSGTTPKVARALHRHYIGFEISAEYCDIIQKRLEQTKSFFD